MVIYPRSIWTSRDYGGTPITRPVPYVIVHYTASDVSGGANASIETECSYMRGIEGYHLSKGFSAIAYSFMIFPSGRIYTGRGFARAGGHTGNNNMNRLGHGLCFAGLNAVPSDAVIGSYRYLIHFGQETGNILAPLPGSNIMGHRDVGAYGGGGTACPGPVYSRLDDIRIPWKEEHVGLDKEQASTMNKMEGFLEGFRTGYEDTDDNPPNNAGGPYFYGAYWLGVLAREQREDTGR